MSLLNGKRIGLLPPGGIWQGSGVLVADRTPQP